MSKILIQDGQYYTFDDQADAFRPRDPYGHKGTFGKLLLIAGSLGMAGAAVLSGRAAIRAGVGMLRLVVSRDIMQTVQLALPEAVAFPSLPNRVMKRVMPVLFGWADAVAIGPGIDMSREREMLVRYALESDLPVVADAGALSLIADDVQMQQLLAGRKARGAQTVLTPHPGELANLLDEDPDEVVQDMAASAGRVAARYHCVVVGKGPITYVSDPGLPTYANVAPNDKLATAGSGDVLTGIIGAYTARAVVDGVEISQEVSRAVFLHSQAGAAAAAFYGNAGLFASDIIDGISMAGVDEQDYVFYN